MKGECQIPYGMENVAESYKRGTWELSFNYVPWDSYLLCYDLLSIAAV